MSPTSEPRSSRRRSTRWAVAWRCRRSALERVGSFDDRMLNYYDDVDYGVRLWRAGYRVVVAADAWIDHRFGGAGADSSTSSCSASAIECGSCSSTRPRGRSRAGRHASCSRRRGPTRRRALEAEGDGVERAPSAERARESPAPAASPARPGAPRRSILGRRFPGGCAVAAEAAP